MMGINAYLAALIVIPVISIAAIIIIGLGIKK